MSFDQTTTLTLTFIAIFLLLMYGLVGIKNIKNLRDGELNPDLARDKRPF